jgi:deoxyribodipyrimidine photo-lyase
VAGLQTQGKSYLATAGNIQKYTSGRFPVSERLATEPVSLPENPPPPIRPLTQLPEPSPKGKIGLLLTEEDLSAADWLPERYPLDAIAGVFPTAGYAELGIEKNVVDFRRSCLGERTGGNLFESIDNFVAWCRQEELQTVILAEPPVGIWSPLMSQLSKSLTAEGIELRPQRHWWDEVFYPNATHGFFRFKKAIPKILQRLNQKALETRDA